MNYEDPELLDRLASEYVLGTMVGAARRRFDRLLLESAPAREAHARWQIRLADLAASLPEAEPPASVWHDIEARIDPAPQHRGTAFGRFVQVWAALASIALVVLLGMRMADEPQLEREQQVAIVNEANATPLWLVSVDLESGELSTRAVSAEAATLDRVYELWMLPAEGNPQSLGLMPVNGGTQRQVFSPALLELLKNAQGLAVSIEPPGGSPTGLPTGPVVYQADLLTL